VNDPTIVYIHENSSCKLVSRLAISPQFLHTEPSDETTCYKLLSNVKVTEPILEIFKYQEKHYNIIVQKQIAFQKTEQLQEGLTFSEISPKWAKRLGELQQEPGPLSITRLRWWFEIIYPPKCVVGEAHGFARSYTYSCRECAKLGDKFSLYYTLHLYSKLEENKKRFVDHWNKEHT